MPSNTPSNITIGTTNIRLNNIKATFIGTTTKLSDYYRGGTNIYDTPRLITIPTSGIIKFSNFINTTNVIKETSTFETSNSAGPFSLNTLRTHALNFALPSNSIVITSINYVQFTCYMSGSRTTSLNAINSFIPYLNSKSMFGSVFITDSTYNYALKINITNTSYVSYLNPTYNSLYMESSSAIPSYSNGKVTINISYII